MKVIELKLRTPGIFLKEPDPSQGISTPKLTLEIRQGDEWVTVDKVPDIKVLKESVPTASLYVTQKNLETGSVKVPLQGEGTLTYQLLVSDSRSWEYRVTAYPCVDCIKVFRSYGMEDRILGSRVLVATGSFNSNGNEQHD